MEIARIFEDKTPAKIYGLIGNINIISNNNNYSIVTEYKFNNTVREYLNSNKDEDSLKIVMLEKKYLDKQVSELSDSEIKKINLAKSLIMNKENIVLEYFEKGLNYREKENYKRIFKKISKDNKKTIIIFTNDIEFIWYIAEEIIIVDKNEVINTITKKDLLKVIDILDKPEITKFIDLIREKGIKIEDYKNPMDLLKAIYRIKGE